MTRRTFTLAFIIVAVLLFIGFYVYEFRTLEPAQPTPSLTENVATLAVVSNEEMIREMIDQFGLKLQMVSLYAPDRAAMMNAYYAPYVVPELLSQWGNEGADALGRYTSNPRPDSIDVVAMRRTGEKYLVEANVIEVTEASKEIAAVYPVTFTIEKREGAWMIVGMDKGAYSEVPHTQTLVGYWECLPVKDPTIEQTLECATGIAIDQSDGHFAVDTMLMSQYPVDFPIGTKVRISGVVVPIDQLSAVQKYDIDGFINATVIEAI